jgi:hypothetical protein
VEEVPAVVPGFDDWGAVPEPDPELPHPDTIPTASIATATNITFVIDFIISPLSDVTPALDNRKPGTLYRVIDISATRLSR